MEAMRRSSGPTRPRRIPAAGCQNQEGGRFDAEPKGCRFDTRSSKAPRRECIVEKLSKILGCLLPRLDVLYFLHLSSLLSATLDGSTVVSMCGAEIIRPRAVRGSNQNLVQGGLSTTLIEPAKL